MSDKEPRLAIGITTIGRETLRRTICAVLAQDIRPTDDVLVVHDGPSEKWVSELIESLGPPWRLVHTPRLNSGARAEYGCGCGSGARQRCIEEARGDVLVWMEDDDVFTDGAIRAIRRRVQENPGKPLIFRFMVYSQILLWDMLGKGIIRENFISGQQLVAPNIEGRLGRCTDRPLYDHDFIRSTVHSYPNKERDVVWCDEIIGLWRPELDAPDTIEPFAPYIHIPVAKEDKCRLSA